MNVFEAIKDKVTTRQAAELYGIRVNRHGMAVCPFHNDKNPSMKVDMQEDRTFENKFAPPVRSEKKIGNTTFTVNSFFLEQTKDGVVSKIERLIKDDVRKKAAAI